MEQNNCSLCRSPKAGLHCGPCGEPLCKKCAVFLEESTFSFLSHKSPDISHTYYCSSCFSAHVEPVLESYNEIMERARQTFFFFNTQKKTLPVLKRSQTRIQVESCVDRNETVLRLAFQAAKLGFNSVIEAEVTSKKVRNEGYQKLAWSGAALPAQLDRVKLERQAEL